MQDGGMQPAMAYTYVPVPVYNMAGMSVPTVTSPMPTVTSPMPTAPTTTSKTPTRTRSRNEEAGGGGHEAGETERVMSPQQQQEAMAYQQAFLQNAVAQNMQIQQQLLMQNQALTQLLSQVKNDKDALLALSICSCPLP